MRMGCIAVCSQISVFCGSGCGCLYHEYVSFGRFTEVKRYLDIRRFVIPDTIALSSKFIKLINLTPISNRLII